MPHITRNESEYTQEQTLDQGRPDASNVKSPSPPTTSFNKDIKRIRRYLDELQRHRAQVLELNPCPNRKIPTDTIGIRFDRFEMRHSLLLAMDYLAMKQTYHAEKEVHHALQIADRLDNEFNLARCFYWLGRIEFQKRNFAAAHAHFRAARLCALDNENPEGCDVSFYLEDSKWKASGDHQGVSEREPSDQAPSTHHGETSQSMLHVATSGSRRKTKREPSTWELPIRPSR